jgi:hypothetical protein
LILEIYGTKSDETWTKGHFNIRNKFPKEVFSKSKDFPSDFGWTQNPRFWGNEGKYMKSKRLEP